MFNKIPEHWLARYANNYHAWQKYVLDGDEVYRRPLGLVELGFHIDGESGGRSDMFALIKLEIRHSLSREEFRRRILLAWTSLRLQHVLLMSRIYENEELGRQEFAIDVPKSKEQILEETTKTLVWVDDHYSKVNGDNFLRHSLNVGRPINPEECTGKVFVLPLEELPNGNMNLEFCVSMAHIISDGMAAFNWWAHLIQLLNKPVTDLERDIDTFRTPKSIWSKLPPAQEDLYPVAGNKARQRWFWAILRVIRHIRKPLPPTFTNPLVRENPLLEATSPPPTYSKVFDYSAERKPMVNTYTYSFPLSAAGSKLVFNLSRSAGTSIGAGGFALVAMAMMELDETRRSSVPLVERQPFSTSFPLNPRQHFGHTAPPDNCMLQFCSGIILPFLPSNLPFEGRFKLLAKQAQRQMKIYQKRGKPSQGVANLEPGSPGRMLADGYLWKIENIQDKLHEKRKSDVNPQGQYPASASGIGPTCIISWLGSVEHLVGPGRGVLGDVNTHDFVAEYRDIKMGVKARINEFFVGSSTVGEILGFQICHDGTGISEESAAMWEEKIKSLVERRQARM